VKRSQRNIEWLETHCCVPEGRLVGQPIKIRPAQRKIIEGIYDSPTRRAIISMGRKNTKTATSAMLILLHLVGPEARRNSQLYSAAQSRDQAGILFRLASKIVMQSPTLRSYVTVRESAKELICPELGSAYKALSADVATNLGLSPAMVVHDELGQVRGPTSDLYDALETAFGAQEDPLSIIISTQAPTDADLLSLLIDDAAKGSDPTTKLFFWTAPLEDDPFAEATWYKANPMLGDILNVAVVRELAETARRMPSKEASFRNLVLNQRVNQSSPLIPRAIWMACAGEPDRTVLTTGPVFAGLDLSARNDLTALAYGAMDATRSWHVWVEFFAPSKGVVDRSRRDRVPYDIWADKGLITLTPGASVDYEFVATRLAELCEEYSVEAIAFDRWRIDVLQKELVRLNVELPLVPFGQGFKDMSPAVDAMEAALNNEQVRHGGNPVLTWCAANCQASSDPAGNRKLDKARSTGRIDGIVALAMMVGSAGMKLEKPAGPSIYETRGIEEISI
jgi:phage terminase large subunit-like protein